MLPMGLDAFHLNAQVRSRGDEPLPHVIAPRPLDGRRIPCLTLEILCEGVIFRFINFLKQLATSPTDILAVLDGRCGDRFIELVVVLWENFLELRFHLFDGGHR